MMHLNQLSFSFLLVNFLLLQGSDAINLKTWMKNIQNNKKLGKLAIPGTHDTGAYRTPKDIGETQDWSPNQQLHNGIRFFDVRISNNHRSDDFEIRHGPLRLGSFKNLIMNPVKNFLNSYPSETIIMSIKNEEDPLDIGRLERDFIKNNAYKFYQHAVSSTTLLGAVRGKIVLFRRYSGGLSIGTKWKYNMAIQDDYNLDAECKNIKILWYTRRVCSPLVGLDYPKKARKVVNFLKKAAREITYNQFFVNFASANFKGLYIGNTAKVSNKAILKFFKDHRRTIVGSIIPMDYPNRVNGLIEAIINNNFNGNLPENIILGSRYNGYWGDWGVPAFCPPGQFVFGYRLRSEPRQGSGDDTALNAVQLRCALKGNIGGYTTIYSSYGTWGTWGNYRYCSGSNNPVIGYYMKIEPKQGSGDDTAANDVNLICKKGGISAPVKISWGKWTPKNLCPTGQAVVGIITRVEGKQGKGDDTALNGIWMYCKSY